MLSKRVIIATALGAMALVGLSCQTKVASPSVSPAPATTPSLPAGRQGVPQVVVPEGKPPPQPVPVVKPQPVPPAQHAIRVLPVPFTPQAPQANWAMPYQEACEEAALLMVAEYFNGNHNSRLEPTYADREILKLIAWQTEHNFPIDVTAAQLVEILAQYYNLAAEVVPYDAISIRSAIDAGKLVILPAAGRLLGNPYFRRPGPWYHMLVVKGYEGAEFITNDPGTKRGESYRYTESDFARAVHDWNGGDVEHGPQVMVVVSGG